MSLKDILNRKATTHSMDAALHWVVAIPSLVLAAMFFPFLLRGEEGRLFFVSLLLTGLSSLRWARAAYKKSIEEDEYR